MYEIKATFVPDEGSRDTMAKNNEATAYTQVHGKGRVLMIVDVKDKQNKRFAKQLAKYVDRSHVGSPGLEAGQALLAAYESAGER